MLVACRLAGLSALEIYYAGVGVGAQRGANVRGILTKAAHLSAAFIACRADHAGKAKIVSGSVALRPDQHSRKMAPWREMGRSPTRRTSRSRLPALPSDRGANRERHDQAQRRRHSFASLRCPPEALPGRPETADLVTAA
jgi:hypothetical protein